MRLFGSFLILATILSAPLGTTLMPAAASPTIKAARKPSAMKPTRLRCEYLSSPLGIDARHPRLSWQFDASVRSQEQTAYQILVASSEAHLKVNQGDLWNSGKVEENTQLHIAYAGKPLVSGQACVWKVRVWDADNQVSAWSAPGRWEMGLLDQADWKAQWIGRTEETAYQPAPLLRRGFTLRGKVKRARAYVCGLGYYELRLNGKKVGDHHLDPGYTRYDRRALYATYDVTRDLQEGKNALGVILGTGWQNVHTVAVWYFEKAPWRAAPKLLFTLRVEYADGQTETISSDADWKTSTGPITFDSIYGGETYDARLEKAGWDTAKYDDSGWQSAKVVAPAKGILSAQAMPPIKQFETITPVKVTQPKPGIWLFDIGQNLAGHAVLTLANMKLLAGTKITLKYGERLHKDGTLDQSNLDMHQRDPSHRFQTDEYISNGKNRVNDDSGNIVSGGQLYTRFKEARETWEPRFVYHGFQYVEVTGLPIGTKPPDDFLQARFVHSAVEPTGEFTCSDELLNRIQRNTRWAYLSNLQSIPTDCPHREKNGWTGDAHLAAEQGLYNFDSLTVYEKWINDLGDEQKPTGELPGIVPSSGWGYEWGNGPAWDSAFLLIPWYLYEYCGDMRVLETHYAGMKRYVDYLTTRAEGGIVSIGLGDWVPWKTETPVSVTSTGYYYRDALIVAKTAELLGKTEEARHYTELAEKIRGAFVAKFVDPKTMQVSNGGQTSLSCALYQDLLAPEQKAAVLKHLVENVDRQNGHIDTGILGAKYILNALLDNGRADVALRIASQKTQPSWGWWLEQGGASTLWESWNGQDSRNHIMFGDISAWFYRALAGITPDPAKPGFGHIFIKPQIVGDLTWAKGVYNSVRGKIVSEWKKEGDVLTLHVEIPANTKATVFIPAPGETEVKESGKIMERADGIAFLRRDGEVNVYKIGSGKYDFVVK